MKKGHWTIITLLMVGLLTFIIVALFAEYNKTRPHVLGLKAPTFNATILQLKADTVNPFNNLSQVIESYDSAGTPPEGKVIPCGGSFRGLGLLVHITVKDLNTSAQLVHGFRVPNNAKTGWIDFPNATPRSSTQYKQYYVTAGTWDFVYGTSDSDLYHCFIDWTGP